MEGFKEFLKDTAGNQLINFWLDCEYYKDAMENFDEVVNMDIRNRLFRLVRMEVYDSSSLSCQKKNYY